MKRLLLPFLLLSISLTSCAPVDLNEPVPIFDTGVDPNAWTEIPAGQFYSGQFSALSSTGTFQIMITDVTVAQYADFLNQALADGTLRLTDEQIFGFYPGDPFHSLKHELRIDPGDRLFIPLHDPSQRIKLDDAVFVAEVGYEQHPMTMVSWFGAWGYCRYYNWRLPTELEWEKAARGPEDARPFPWGWKIARNNANFYASRDPFEDMRTVGSRTTPVGFYNGNTYNGFVTLNSVSPYGLYDMAGDVWQWIGDVQPQTGFSDRLMHGGSKDTYDIDLRIWVRNSAPPVYYGPGVGFRCARDIK